MCDPESRSGNTEDLNKKSTKWEAVKSRERERGRKENTPEKMSERKGELEREIW